MSMTAMAANNPSSTAPGTTSTSKASQHYTTPIALHQNTLKQTPHKYASHVDAAGAGLPATTDNALSTIDEPTITNDTVFNFADTAKHSHYAAQTQTQAQAGKQEEAPFTPCHTAVHSSRPSSELAGWCHARGEGGDEVGVEREGKVGLGGLGRDSDDEADPGMSLFDELIGGGVDDEDEDVDTNSRPDQAGTHAVANVDDEFIDEVKRAGDRWGMRFAFCALNGSENGYVKIWRPRVVPICYLDAGQIFVVLLWVVGVCFMMEDHAWIGIGFMGIAAVTVGFAGRI